MNYNKLKKYVILILLAITCISTIGCGETVSGAGKDIGRVGKGIKTIFIRESSE